MFTSLVPNWLRFTPLMMRIRIPFVGLFMDDDEDIFVGAVHVQVLTCVFFQKNAVVVQLFESVNIAHLVLGRGYFFFDIVDFAVEGEVGFERVGGKEEEIAKEDEQGAAV